MIWVLAGTGDSFRLIDKLIKYNTDIIASVVTDYGKKKLKNKNIEIIKKKLKLNDMKELIEKHNVELIIDATHPFAENVSKNSMAASLLTGIEYIRYEREVIDLSQYPAEYIISVHSYQEAAKKVKEYNKIFLTIGSNNLQYFTSEIDNWPQRITARILPDWRFIKKADKLGFDPGNLVALQGPFSYELNRAIFKEYEANVLVSKASGNIGGLDTKIKAAIDLSIPIVIIRRPELDYPVVFNNFVELLDYCFSGEVRENEE